MPTPLAIRRATPSDAALLAELGRKTFTDTFAYLYPPEDLEGFLDHAYAPETFARFLAADGHALWLAELDGRTVGYAQAGPCALPHPEATPHCGELKRLYVRGEDQGDGVGSALLDEALGWLEAPGRRLWIGVWSKNFGAQKLYASRGFEKVGEYEFPVGNTRDHEFILSRPGAPA
jgi:ribosomal protein S18 acetylase RimI-like enzyme